MAVNESRLTGFLDGFMADLGPTNEANQAVDFATLAEPSNSREYVAVHQALGVGPEDRLLDIGCGGGLAIELARVRGAMCAGVDRSRALVDIARFRNADADIRCSSADSLPWDHRSFDVVTMFRSPWHREPDMLREIHRVLAPGGRIALTSWGRLDVSPGGWALTPVSTDPPMRAEILTDSGFVDVKEFHVPFAWEFADPELYARAMASTSHGAAIVRTVGESEFLEAAMNRAREYMREGKPLRAPINVIGHQARKPGPATDLPQWRWTRLDFG